MHSEHRRFATLAAYAASRGSVRAVKVLIADDSRAMRHIVAAMLRKAGFRSLVVIEAVDGADALSKARVEHPDLVISDWHMPRMSGIEVLKRLRDEGIQTPFGFVTTGEGPEMRALAERSGASFLIGKPFTPSDFVRALGDQLEWIDAPVDPVVISPVMPRGTSQATLADVGSTEKLFSTTLRRTVTATVVHLPESSLLVAGHYVNDAGTVVGGCFADRALATYAGAALSLVPAAAAHESIAADRLDELLLENFAEILDICSRLFDRASDRRISLRTVERGPDQRSALSLAILRDPAQRRDLELDISGYGKGGIVLAVMPA